MTSFMSKTTALTCQIPFQETRFSIQTSGAAMLKTLLTRFNHHT